MTGKSIRHTANHYGLRDQAKDFPMMAVLSFVYVCNAHCPNCPYNNSEIRSTYKDSLYMSENVFKKLADEFGQYRSLLRISGGGEPMLHPQAVELLCYAKEKGAKIGLITNGSCFNENKLRALIGAGVDAIEFSVDAGDAETYARVRGLDWERLNRNVVMAVALRDAIESPSRIVASIINQEGVDVAAAEAHWIKIVDKVQIRKYLTWGINEDHSADATPYLPPEERIPCPWLFERLNVDSRGDVTLCGEDIAFKYKFSNIMTQPIREIWHGPVFQELRDKHLRGCGAEINICSTCPDWKYRSWNYNYWKVLKDAKNRG